MYAQLEYDMLADADKFRPLHLESVRKALKLFRARDKVSIEAKLTTLLTVDDDAQHKLYVHCQPLGDRPKEPVKIQVMGAPRDNAMAKDSGWVTDRQGLWDAREEDVHEVVLKDEDGGVYEGLSSNFMVIHNKDGKGPVLQTARCTAVAHTASRNAQVRKCVPTHFLRRKLRSIHLCTRA